MHQEAKLIIYLDLKSEWIIPHAYHFSPWLHMVTKIDVCSKNKNNIIALFYRIFSVPVGTEEECCRNGTNRMTTQTAAKPQKQNTPSLLEFFRWWSIAGRSGVMVTGWKWMMHHMTFMIQWPRQHLFLSLKRTTCSNHQGKRDICGFHHVEGTKKYILWVSVWVEGEGL